MAVPRRRFVSFVIILQFVLIGCHGDSPLNVTTEGVHLTNELLTLTDKQRPPSCTCPTISDTEIEISSCRENPGKPLDDLLLTHQDINYLTIWKTPITQVPQSVCYLYSIYFLDVSFNHIESLPWDCLQKLPQLRCLVAEGNKLKAIRGVDFSTFPSLYELRFANNEISEIDSEAFRHVDQFTTLNHVMLSGNRLVDVGPWAAVLMLSNVEVNLDKNNISCFTNNINWIFQCPTSESYGFLSMQENLITHISDIFKGWGVDDDEGRSCLWGAGGHVKINLRGNPLSCDCGDYDVYRIIDMVRMSPTLEDLRCMTPLHHRRKRLIYVPRDELICDLKEACPEGCECLQQPRGMNMSVGCEGKALTELPNALPPLPKHGYTYHLNLMHNNIKIVDTKDYLYYTKQALFSHNLIRNVTVSALEALSGAESILMDNNKLQALPRNISQVSLTSVHQVSFHSNPWICDCNAVETTNWLIGLKGVLSDGSDVQCAWPNSMQGLIMLQLSQQDLLCDNDTASSSNSMLTVVLESVGSTLLACGILIVIPIVVLCKKKVWVYKKLNWHPLDKDECIGEDKKFDVFVSYANEDEDYAEHYLINALESKGYKVAYHRVNFLGGTPIHVSIEGCIQQSKRTLVVLSNNFIQSSWCMWELTVALEKDGNEGTHRLLAIKYDEVDVKSLDLTLRAYFDTHTYIERDCAKFWDNLQYALPTIKLGRQQGGAHNDGRDDENLVDADVLQNSVNGGAIHLNTFP